ncbi:MAG: hypothetical protein M9916_01280 [Crocinitomicaceae bacterium]|nr:hypothetical protein [Crocinitomicaceae bacterium]
MKKTVGILFLLILLVGCSKEIENNRAISGYWIPDNFSLTDYDGLKTHPSCYGEMRFSSDGKKSKSGSYNFQIYFDFNGNPLNLIEEGTYVIDNKNIAKLTPTNGKASQMTIVYKTKEDLVLDFPNRDYLAYNFVMKRVKGK